MTSVEYLMSKKVTPVIKVVGESNQSEVFVTMTTEQFEEYGKYCAEQAFTAGFYEGQEYYPGTFSDFWSEFQRKEETE